MAMSVTMDSQNRVSQFKLPTGGPNVAVAGNPNIKGALYNKDTAILTVALSNGLIGQFKSDGSYEWKQADGSAASV